jgi:hypothetical protein
MLKGKIPGSINGGKSKWAAGLAGSLRNQQGTALVLTLSMLALMSILGALALSTSTTELGISGNLRSSQEAFYAAERAVEYAMTNGNIYSIIATGEESLDGYNGDILIGRSGLRLGAGSKVEYLSSGALPPGSGSDPTYFQSRYYIISVIGEGPNNSVTRVEEQVGRIVPK